VWLLHEQLLKKLRSGLAAFKAGLQERQGGAAGAGAAAAGAAGGAAGAAETTSDAATKVAAAAAAGEGGGSRSQAKQAAALSKKTTTRRRRYSPYQPYLLEQVAEADSGDIFRLVSGLTEEDERWQDEDEDDLMPDDLTPQQRHQLQDMASQMAAQDPPGTQSDSPGTQSSSEEAESEIEELPLFGVVVTGTASAGDKQRQRRHQVSDWVIGLDWG
jgi:hypothetical protein